MSELKDSGIAWVGVMPDSWKIKRGKFTLKLLNRPLEKTDDVITCFRDGEVTLRKNRREEGFTVSLKEIGYQGIEPGDLVIHGMDGFAGAIGISDSRGKSSPVLVVCDSDENKRFIMYYLRTMAYNDVFSALATGIRVRSCDLRWNKLAELPYILPSQEEQKRIVSFLDGKCTQIDTLIQNVQTQIEKLKAYKQSLITEVVTKGLDPTVPMKDSGVEWIGEIPEHWNIISLGGVTSEMRNGYVGPTRDLFVDNGVRYIQSLHTKDGLIDFYKHPYYVREEWANQHPKVHTGDVLIVQTGDIGQVALVNDEFDCCNCHALIIATPNQTIINPGYLTYYLLSSTGKELMLSFKTGALLPHLNSGKIKSSPICVPDMEAQIQIVDYLRDKLNTIETLIAIKQAKIEKLEQYKRSLIYEYVTGKKEVV